MIREKPARFIAGAVCPECGAEDRVKVKELEGRTQRHCVACGFADEMWHEPEPELPSGRLDGPARRPLPEGTQPLVFVPPKTRH